MKEERAIRKSGTNFESLQKLLETVFGYVGPIVLQPFLWTKLIIVSCNNNFDKNEVTCN